MESDALDRYSQLARRFRQGGAADLGEVFVRLCGIQTERVNALAHLATRQHEAPPVAAPSLGPIPDTFDAAAPEIVPQSKLLTPYRALAAVVRREERAFAFWTYVAAHAESANVRRAAEQMALEALQYAAILRRERRKAFHAQRRAYGATRATFNMALLAAKERQLAEIIEQNPALLGMNVSLAPELAATSREAASKLEQLEAAYHPRVSLPNLPADVSTDPLAISEFLAEAYLDLADTSRNDEVVMLIQGIAGAAIHRLAMLRARSNKTQDRPMPPRQVQ